MKYLAWVYRSSLVIMALLMTGAAGAVWYEAEQSNFHAISPGEAYRSAQLNGDELDYFIKKYHIKSVLNLRGKDAAARWYADELKVSAKNNISHYDIALSAYKEPQERDIESLMGIFMNAPRPLLMHCQAGADRSGLAAAMWKLVVDKEPKAEATKQLSILYGHLMIGKAAAMDNFFEKWDPVYVSPVLNVN